MLSCDKTLKMVHILRPSCHVAANLPQNSSRYGQQQRVLPAQVCDVLAKHLQKFVALQVLGLVPALASACNAYCHLDIA